MLFVGHDEQAQRMEIVELKGTQPSVSIYACSVDMFSSMQITDVSQEYNTIQSTSHGPWNPPLSI